ncbi:hypothetical protein OGAPHI_000466 [Ogataea philodendri]|uniref:Uncharacterized protein n=1 Tax=Ogataea philodendri TaxID=1378263 RepID=A0A9P8PFK1_9ASCO|nr:uncharacterized protein OGAPHI_000466 [Ogataea philodendri]KAH3671348.1 hypothetical protein OGAPHI_000466 [Ogataea philodendri]
MLNSFWTIIVEQWLDVFGSKQVHGYEETKETNQDTKVSPDMAVLITQTVLQVILTSNIIITQSSTLPSTGFVGDRNILISRTTRNDRFSTVKFQVEHFIG